MRINLSARVETIVTTIIQEKDDAKENESWQLWLGRGWKARCGFPGEPAVTLRYVREKERSKMLLFFVS